MFFKKNAADGPIGLIAGQGDFPLLFAEAASSLKKDVVVFGIEGCTDKRIENFAKKTHYLQWGAYSRLVDLLKETKIKHVVLAGGVPKKEIYNPNRKLDKATQDFFKGTQNKGDDHLLRAFLAYLKAKCGVSVMDSKAFLKHTLASKGVMTDRKPSEQEWRDLKFGYPIAKGIGKLDIGQTVAVKDGTVLAVEAIEGTDAAIRRGGQLGHGGAVIIKVSKPTQDLRFDLPCMGFETIESLKAVSSRVLGVEAGKTIMLFKEKVIEKANEEGMTLVGL